jgi:spore coat protein U-like protein
VVCSLTGQTIIFGTSSTATGTIGYSCTSYNASSTSLTLCSQLGSPSWPGTAAQPKMLDSAGNQLSFNLYTDAGRSTVWIGSTVITKAISVPASGTVTGSIPFYGAIPTGQGVPAGSYTGYFYATSIAMLNAGSCMEHVASVFDGTNNTLTATASVSNACRVAATNLSLGNIPATSTAISGSTTISVTCPNGTPYYIGLSPSNGSSTGAGAMSGTGGNTDHPAYQLRSTSGSSGTIWGNTATSSSVGNGVAGTGTGAAQNRSVYLTMPSANFQPGTYSDTVTINVNY